jgi:hypothetical protein
MFKIKRIVPFLMIFCFSTAVFAQKNKEMEELVEGTKNDLLMVIGGGLAGAVLGLSTLSFVDEPKEHTRNIVVGASLGIIAGVAYVAYSQASKSRDMMYGPEAYKIDPKNFDTVIRLTWHHEHQSEKSVLIDSANQIGFAFKY